MMGRGGFFLVLVVVVLGFSLVGAQDDGTDTQTPTLPQTFQSVDNILINCGANESANDGDGRSWKGDVGTSIFLPSGSSLQAGADSQDPGLPSDVPYMTARIINKETTYTFNLTEGRHWVRLHFYPSSYSKRDPANGFFSVKAGDLTLLKNFSAWMNLQALTQSYIMREFSIYAAPGKFSLTFTPETSPNSSSPYYAFVNGIEVISMPGMFTTAKFIDLASGVDFEVKQSYGLQTMVRLNVGGASISPSQDSNLTRTWYDDSPYVFGAALGVTDSGDAKMNISYTEQTPTYIAPPAVYSSSRSMGPTWDLNTQFNLTWLISVDPNFRYLVRMHFCENEYTKVNQRVFDVYINNKTAIPQQDVLGVELQINPDHPQNTAVFSDFVTFVGNNSKMNNDTYLWVSMTPDATSKPQYYDALLNGLEVFKISDQSTGNLAGPNAVIQSVQLMPPSPPQGNSGKSSSSSKTPLIGGIAGGIAALILVGLGVCCFCCRKKARSDDGASSGWIPLILNSYTMGSKTSKKSSNSTIFSTNTAGLCRHFTFEELREGTNNFDESEILGVGGFGNVYRGVVDGNTKVAVKRGNPQSEQGMNEFQTEIEMLSKLRHKHLVSLIGYCEEKGEMILVYDYMGNGTLRGHLYKTDAAPLSWKQRLEICIGAARGLHYLHTGARHTIIHRDVKTTNILLDDNFVAKVSDFGLSKTGPALDHTHVSTVVKGSFGYLDPEYFRRQQLTEKSDVYSFGVVLFEALCARAALNPALPREQVSLAEWAVHCKRKGTLEHIVDPHLKGKIYHESLKKFADIAEKCVAENGIDRPSMGDVLWNLEFALQLQESAMGNKSIDENCVVDMETEPSKFGGTSKSTEGEAVSLVSMGGQSVKSEDSDDVTPSVVFSQLVNPTGR